MAGTSDRGSFVMAILPCEAAVVPAQRHARVYSPEHPNQTTAIGPGKALPPASSTCTFFTAAVRMCATEASWVDAENVRVAPGPYAACLLSGARSRRI